MPAFYASGGVEVVQFFLRCEQQDIRIAHCPAYVREWMAREQRPT